VRHIREEEHGLGGRAGLAPHCRTARAPAASLLAEERRGTTAARRTTRAGVRPGDERATEERLRDSSSLAFRVAYGVLRNRADAEDVAQEALVRALTRIESLRDRERFRAWLVRITWRAALDRRRADARRLRRDGAAAPTDAPRSVEEMAVSDEREMLVWRAVDALPEKLRLVTVLAAIDGHDTRAVAALIGVAEGTVKSRLHAARGRLEESLRWLKT
jgi:RNA polymerase sigma-70 factor, ECF subfamily